MKFTMTDEVVERPMCVGITVCRTVDEQADVSYLDQSDDEMGEGFEAGAAERKAGYGTEWQCLHIQAEAVVLVPMGPDASCIQVLYSPGVGGIESDSDAEYLAEQDLEQVDELKVVLDALHIYYDDDTQITNES